MGSLTSSQFRWQITDVEHNYPCLSSKALYHFIAEAAATAGDDNEFCASVPHPLATRTANVEWVPVVQSKRVKKFIETSDYA